MSHVTCHVSHVTCHQKTTTYLLLFNFIYLFFFDRQTDIADSRLNQPIGPIRRKLDFQFNLHKKMTLRRHFLGQKNAAKHPRICSSFDDNVAATRLRQTPLFPCYSPLPVDPKEEGSKEIFLLIPV